MASSSSSPSALPVEVGRAITAFLAGAYEDEKTSLVEVTLPPAILAPFITSPPSLRLVDLIKNLGSSFTSEDEIERSRAVVLLSLLVTALASDHPSSSSSLFDKQATTTLAHFFASKLEDGNVVAGNVAKNTNAITEIVPGSAPESRRKKYPPGTEMLVTSVRALTALATMEKFASEAAKVTTER
jgi:DNA repair/transcription protein MET18/MMS19